MVQEIVMVGVVFLLVEDLESRLVALMEEKDLAVRQHLFDHVVEEVPPLREGDGIVADLAQGVAANSCSRMCSAIKMSSFEAKW